MARGRRRSSRLGGGQTAVTTPEPAQAAPSSTTQDAADSTRQDDEKCPACEGASTQVDKVDQENWVRCDACRTWFHWRCVGEGDLEAIDKWCAPSPPPAFFLFVQSLRRILLLRLRYCKSCMEEDSKRVITLRPPARKSSRKRTQRDYAGLHNGQDSDPNR